MKNSIQIEGIGCTAAPGSAHIDKSFKELLVEAVYDALKDANIDADEVDGASFSYAGEGEIGHGGISPTLVDALGLSSIPAFVNVANCASAHVALIQGCEMIETGRYKHVLVAGFDKFTDVLPFENYMLLSTDSMYDYNLGFSHIDSFLLQSEYFRKYSISSIVAKKSLLKMGKMCRQYGSQNTVASFYGKEVPTDTQLEKMPFFGNAMQAGEGASAVILSVVKNKGGDRVVIKGRGLDNTSHYMAHRYEPFLLKQVSRKNASGLYEGLPLKISVNRAYQEAHITEKDVDIIELYDQGINTFLSLEAIGICAPGKAPEYILNGGGDISSKCPINTDGGNVARGHAAGGASLYQIIEIVKQLQGRSTGKQINPHAKYGLSTVIGGAYATTAAFVLENIDKGRR